VDNTNRRSNRPGSAVAPHSPHPIITRPCGFVTLSTSIVERVSSEDQGMPAVHDRPEGRSGARRSPLVDALLAAIPAQRDRPGHEQVIADDHCIEALRAGHGTDAADPVIRSLARWRASIVEGT
jgi:hypothetical protein